MKTKNCFNTFHDKRTYTQGYPIPNTEYRITFVIIIYLQSMICSCYCWHCTVVLLLVRPLFIRARILQYQYSNTKYLNDPKNAKINISWRNKTKSLLDDRNELFVCSKYNFNKLKPLDLFIVQCYIHAEWIFFCTFLYSCIFIDNLTTVITYMICFTIVSIQIDNYRKILWWSQSDALWKTFDINLKWLDFQIKFELLIK